MKVVRRKAKGDEKIKTRKRKQAEGKAKVVRRKAKGGEKIKTSRKRKQPSGDSASKCKRKAKGNVLL